MSTQAAAGWSDGLPGAPPGPRPPTPAVPTVDDRLSTGVPAAGGPARLTGLTGRCATDDFDDFVAARAASLVRSARRLLADPQEAEDVVQEVLVKVHRHWDSILRREVPDAYVHRMLVNTCISFWRRGSRRDRPLDATSLTGAIDRREQVPDSSSRIDQREAVLALLRRLPAKQRAVLVLRHFEGLDDAAVAAVMGTTVHTVRSNVHRGLATLRVLITEHKELLP